MIGYEKAPKVADIVKALIDDKDLDQYIKEAKITCLFTLQEKSRYRARIQKPTGVWRFLSDYDFVLLVHQKTWTELDDKQKHALIYHELKHVTHREEKGEGVFAGWKLRKHDIEEFVSVVSKYGAWTEELQTFREALIGGGKK